MENAEFDVLQLDTMTDLCRNRNCICSTLILPLYHTTSVIYIIHFV